MASIRTIRELIVSKPALAALVIPSAKNEIYLDINGDGKADFAVIDSSCDFTGNGLADTYAIDLGKDGEFDLYLRDTDGNWIPDQITYFKDGTLDPVIQTHPEQSREMIEKCLEKPGKQLVETMTKLSQGGGTLDEFKACMTDYSNGVRAALKALWEAYQNSQN